MNRVDIELICKLNKNWRPETIKIERAGGQTNRNWLVQYKNKKFFVRLPWERTDIVDRNVEAGNILAIAKCQKLRGILPKYYLYIFKGKNILSPTRAVAKGQEEGLPSSPTRAVAKGQEEGLPSSPKQKFDLPDGTMILEYIEGKDIDGKDLEKPKNQTALLNTLCTFHKSRVKFVNVYDVFRDEVQKYRKKAKKYPINKLIKKERIEKIEKIEKIAKKKLTFCGGVSTHNDLIFENLRLSKTGRVYLLDFEYAGFNIRDGLPYDLGIILGGNLFQKNPIKLETFEEILKKAKKIYKKDLDDGKIYCGALTNILVMFWWGLVKYFSSTEKEEKKYFQKYVLGRAKGIEFLHQFIKKNKVPR